MTWYGLLLVLVALSGTTWLWRAMYAGKGAHCIGCGMCMRTGYCVLAVQQSGREGKSSGTPWNAEGQKEEQADEEKPWNAK